MTSAKITTNKRSLPSEDGIGLLASVSTTKRAKHSRLVKKSTRNQLEAFYDPVIQPKANAFWPGRIFPSKDLKDESQRRLFPPIGMSFMSGSDYEWLDPDVITSKVCDWLRFVTTANVDLICREFEEENMIRSLMKDDPDMKMRMSDGTTTIYVAASTYFREGSIHYGSWSLYGRLLMFLDKHGYITTRSMITRSHVLSFISTSLPSVLISYAESHANDTVGDMQCAIACAIDNMLTAFVVTRNALYGYDGQTCKLPADSVVGKMALTVSRNCGQRLRIFIKHDDLIKKYVLGEIHPLNRVCLGELGITGPPITMSSLFTALRVDERVRDMPEYWDTHEEMAGERMVSKGFDVTIVPIDAVHALVDELVKHVYEERDDSLQPNINMDNIGHACCLIEVLYGGRCMGVLGCDAIMPFDACNDANDINNDRECIKRLIDACSIDNMLVVRSTCKDYKLRGVVDSSKLGLDVAGSCTRIALWGMLAESFRRVYPNHAYNLDGSFEFMRLLQWTRRFIRTDIYTNGDADWTCYKTMNGDFPIMIDVIDNPDRSVSNFRSCMPIVYTLMKNVCNDVLGKYTKIPLSGTHALRRLYVSIAYARYADEKMTMASFIRVNLDHISSTSSHAYDNIRVVDHSQPSVSIDDDEPKTTELDELKSALARLEKRVAILEANI